jgi:hypothetical protein
MIKQILYVDYCGGNFETWFYSDGDRYRGRCSYDYNDILRYAKKNDFTDIIQTDSVKNKLIDTSQRHFTLRPYIHFRNF